MNKPVYLGLLTLEISKLVMQELWYGYIKPKYGKKAKLCHMETESFIFYIKKEDIHVDIVKDVGTRFDTSSYELERVSPKGKNLKSNRINER